MHGTKDQQPPFFLITIDTEGDNLWTSPKNITTQNASFLPRFQSLCDHYGFKPTYLTNYEMAIDPVFQEFGRDVIQRKVGEIGMHLHAWNSPPIQALTDDDYQYLPYLTEYPPQIIRDKIDYLTQLLEDTFGIKMTSHRSGRWALNEFYISILEEKGYLVDCSVTPHISWRDVRGDPEQNGGTDYTHFLEEPYFLDLNNIQQPGNSKLLEVPMTIISTKWVWLEPIRKLAPNISLLRRVMNRLLRMSWLRPGTNNLNAMLAIVQRALHEKRSCVEFMLHSSEFMPGGSPTFPDRESIDKLYENLEILFETASKNYTGAGLTDFYHFFVQRSSTKALHE